MNGILNTSMLMEGGTHCCVFSYTVVVWYGIWWCRCVFWYFFSVRFSRWTCHISLFDKKKNFSYILYDRDARRWFLKGLLLLNENTVAVFVFIMFIRSTSVFSPFIFIIQRIVSKEKSCLVQSLLLFFFVDTKTSNKNSNVQSCLPSYERKHI